MSNIGYVEAFKKYGAKLDNPMWAVSAIASDGSLVLSCWSLFFKSTGDGALRYIDSLGRWNGNPAGNNLLRKHLTEAYSNNLSVRMIVATPEDPKEMEASKDASKIKKKFHTREDVEGRITEFDGDNFVIEFRRKL